MTYKDNITKLVSATFEIMKRLELKLDQISLKKVAIASRQENYKYLKPSRQANNLWVLISELYNGGDIDHFKEGMRLFTIYKANSKKKPLQTRVIKLYKREVKISSGII